MTDRVLLAAALALVFGVWQHAEIADLRVPLAVLALVTVAVVFTPSRPRVAPTLAIMLVLVVVGSMIGGRAWSNAAPRHLGEFTGWARIAADPVPFGRGLRVAIEVDGERFDAWVYGGRSLKLVTCQEGEWWWVSGTRVAASASGTQPPTRMAVRHVVGRFQVDVSGDVVSGSTLSTASNRVRSAVRASADATMRSDDAALFTGLVLGDDARQPSWLVDRFRRCGMSHLTAVSGQNVAFVLAACGPLLRRLRPWLRWVGTVLVVLWFMAVTRFEPSVVRAGVMATIAATSFVSGATTAPRRLIALTVLVIVTLDPLLVWSVGLWLSIGATCGLLFVTPRLRSALPGPEWLAGPMAVTIGAQAGVALPSLLVFGRLPLLSIPVNLVAVPVAGLVMLYGLPVAVVAGGLPGWLCTLLMFPAEAGTRWVSAVASVGAAIEPTPGRALVGWLLVLAAASRIARRRRRSRTTVARVPF